jgi:hypothetical protein
MAVKWITRVLAIVALAYAPALTGCAPADDGGSTEEAPVEEAADDAAAE